MSKNSPSGFLSNVEGARGIAACLVVLYHAARHIRADIEDPAFATFTNFGHAGVDFFFVLSGFIIYFVHAGDIGKSGRLLHYVKRRVTRIYPLYWPTLMATLLIAWLSQNVRDADSASILSDALLLPLATTTVGVAWTLQNEMLFYLLFALLIVLGRRGWIAIAAWALVIAFGFSAETRPENYAFATLSDPYNVLFLAGILVAALSRNYRPPYARALAVAGFALFLTAGILENLSILDGEANYMRLAYGVGSALALIGLVEGERSGQFVLWRPIITAGQASYAIYLLHLIVIAVTWQFMAVLGIRDALGSYGKFWILVVSAIGLSMAGSRLVERPLISLARRALDAATRANQIPPERDTRVRRTTGTP